MVSDNDVIYIESGTTTTYLIPYFATKKNLTIITASIQVINLTASYPQINVIATGGVLFRPTNSFVGANAINCLKHYNISKTFFSSNGFSIKNGVTNAHPLECEIKRYLMENSQKKILLVDSSKVDTASVMTFCQLKDMDCFVMDQKPPQEYLNHFAKYHIKLITKDDKE